ncbi:hypothetical protein K492DRAFT_136622 [Lichtheimia hyalospora FSU 10163]|nr:hypothetical protein K492DRAFT_136622 [Lichtheimia hyalospora FSU 10163]
MPKDDATIEFKIDPYFTGIMHGFPDDESEGCVLKGTCILHVHRPVKVRRFIVWFEGRTKVNLRGQSSIGVSSTEMTEARTLCYKSQHFMGDNGEINHLQPGRYEYPFSFDLPATLPASFRGKYGCIRYRLQSTLFRTMFSTDIHHSREIVLRRCLIDENLTSAAAADMTDTVHGENQMEQLQYSATSTTMAYREGGIVKLNLNMHLGRPNTQSVRSVTCALREVIRYRTTGERSITCQSAYKTEELFPLGWSTFYPSQAPDYDPASDHDYNAVFRLCPRVHADTETRLVEVKHHIIINMMVEERRPDPTAHAPQQLEDIMHQLLPTPPTSRPSTPKPSLSRSSSSSSISSIFSLKRDSSSRRSSISHESQGQQHLTLCTLEIPIMITSREHIWDGAMPSPPAYNTTEAPPSYFQTIEQLPAVPTYPESITAN